MKTKILCMVVLLSALVLSACGDASSDDEVSLSGVHTAVAGTFTAEAALATATETASPTASPTPSATPTTSPTPSQTSLSFLGYATSTASVVLCNNSIYVSDVTIADGTVLAPDEAFTKTWLLQNTGTCTWGEDYAITFASGAEMDGSSTEIDETVSPGEEVYVSVDLIAPSSEGTYVGYWKMADSDGNTFGTSVYVQIVVSEDAITQTPTSTTEYTSTPEPTSTTAPTSTNTTAPVSTDTPVPTEASTGDSGDTTS